ncbi:HAD domain-containing protein [Streptomyces sp. NPDC014801]|uniref:HAD domain-containing protein n=1 Tax=Streptomyces sp. NPDC014801 TaxID=3364916 RepID=UPI0036FD2BE7
MTSADERPLLFLDIDGPLIPFGAPRAAAGLPPSGDQGNPLLERLDPRLGPRLSSLGCRLVWASTWREEANEVVAPRLGLPELSVVEWPDAEDDADPGPRGLHWKTRALADWAGRRPFVWLDDEISETDRLWVGARHPAPALLHRVDPAAGLTDTDFATVAAWLRALPPPTSRRPAGTTAPPRRGSRRSPADRG